MTKPSNETNLISDFLGTPIEEGSLIVYASMYGNSPRLTLAEVIEVKPSNNRYYKWSIKVQPMTDSAYGDWRFKQLKKDEEGKYRYVKSDARPVTLKMPEKIMVIT